MGQKTNVRTGLFLLGFGTAAGLTGALVMGCGGGSDGGVAGAKLPAGARSTAIEHEACDESGHKVELVDVNGDQKPDIRRVYAGSREICRISDLNRDGKPDLFEYFDETGQIRRREADFDDNGLVNVIEIYKGGKLVAREIDTANQGRIDTWDVFDPATGKITKRERDATGDGRIDQWWTYEGDRVTITRDRDGDGQPDPDATFVAGLNGGPAPRGPEPAGSVDAGAPAFDASAPTLPPPPEPTTAEPPLGGLDGAKTDGGAKK